MKQMTFVRRLAVVSVLCLSVTLISGPSLLAQSTTQGAIGGSIFDATNAVVPGASVTIHNNGTNAEIHLTSDASGYFKAPLLEPGTYTVSISAPGFAATRMTAVTVQVGQITTVEPHLASGSTATTVEVTAESPILNFESPDFSSNVPQAAIANLPMNNRRWSSLAMTTPGVVSDSNGFGLVSIRGISPLLNNVLIDGADDNQAFFAEERGRTREAYSTSGSAVREFAVNSGVYSAEYGRAAGGVINSVTKSGTNHFHGTAYFFDRQSKWNAFNDFTTLTTPEFTGTNPIPTGFTVSPLKPKDLRKIYGFSVGGPIIKDKLFFFYTYDQHSHIFPGTAIPNSAKAFFALPDSALPAGSVCSATTGYLSSSPSSLDSETCTLAARQKISYSAAAAAYAAGVVALNTDLGTVPRVGDQEINTPKLDYQINQKNHVSFLYHRLRWDSPGGVQTAPAVDYAVDTFGNDFVKLDYGVAKLSTLISSHISNELLYQYGRELDYETQQPYSAYTLANLTSNGTSNVPYVNVNTSVGFNLGSPYYSYRTAYPDERKWQIGDVVYDTIGNHTIKAGFDGVHNYDLMNNTYESNGDFSYSYISNYIDDLMNKQSGKANNCNSSALDAATLNSKTGAITSALGNYPCYGNFYQGFGNPVFDLATFDYGVFVQDNWKFSPRLTFELGVRYDYQFIPTPLSNLTTATGSFVPYAGIDNHPSDKNNIGPRVGFSWDVYGAGKTVLRGGYGMYYGRITNGNIENVLLNTGSPNGQYTVTYKANTAGAPTFPTIVGSGSSSAKPNSYYFASNLQNPLVHEFDLAVQQQLGRSTVLSVSYLGALGRELPNFINENLNPATVNTTITVADPTGKGPLGPAGSTYTVPTYVAYGNTALFGTAAANFQAITKFTSNINSNYNGVVFEVENHSLHLVQFDANYTWSHALDYAQNVATQGTSLNWYDPYSNARANYGNSGYNVPNRFVGYALVNIPNMQEKRWTNYLTNDWSINDTFQMQNGLPYSLVVSGYAGSAILSDWNGASGATFIPEIGRNTYKYPRKIVDDLRVQKEIPIHQGINLQLLANVFNLANHQNIDGISNTGYKLTSNGSTTGIATFQGGQSGTTAFGTVTSSNNSGFLYTPRQIEIAARLNF